MMGRSGERGSGISVLASRHDDDDDIILITIIGTHKISAYNGEYFLEKKMNLVT